MIKFNEDNLPMTAVNNMSLEIKRGEFMALVGPSEIKTNISS